MNNIYLCGFMGCGKSTIGILLAKKLGRRFLDLDSFIEKRAGITIEELFRKDGEDGFRVVEASVLEEVCLMRDAVVSLGGGTLSYERNIIAAKNSGKVIYLSLPFSTCYRRIKGDKRRPIAQKSKEELLSLYNRRHTIYKICANYIYEPVFPPEYCAKQLAEMERRR